MVKVLKEAKLDIRGVGLHTFRHTFASRLIMAGVPLIQISKWLGHRNITMTQVYAHLEPTSGREDINKINFEKEKIATSQLRRIFKRRESVDK
ncbi:MAG: tyrosine-type recombinase/integrase [Candidatus Marinimicrobia bacterium]|nr:tyrosine-type recombinase/integrase [Candidatus Neomarinimicrobiota bacterium]